MNSESQRHHDFLGERLGRPGILSFTMTADDSDSTKKIIDTFNNALRDGTPVSMRYELHDKSKIVTVKYRVIKFERVNDAYDVEITVFDEDEPTVTTLIPSPKRSGPIPASAMADFVHGLRDESADRARNEGRDGS